MDTYRDSGLGLLGDPTRRAIFELLARRPSSVGELVEQQALASYARLCGRTLARAHARSADPAVLAGYMGKSGAFDSALASCAMAYAMRTRDDHAQLVKAKGGAKGHDKRKTA